MRDRLKYEIFNYLWTIWHMRSRRYFDSFTPNTGYAKFICESRPWWHMCCNGDCGGWRTHLCNYLERSWRYTNYYERGGE
jgi:hypothetical protein